MVENLEFAFGISTTFVIILEV